MVKIEQTFQIRPLVKTEQQPASSQHSLANSRASQQPQSAISGSSQAIEQAFVGLAAQPEVDLAKVAQIKLALANGTLALDDGQLAQAIVDFHK
jgi:negative regulator of flagellin synthesis FlgM